MMPPAPITGLAAEWRGGGRTKTGGAGGTIR